MVRTAPLYSGFPTCFTLIVAPLQKMKSPTRVDWPLLNKAVVNPPISWHWGTNVLTAQPINNGITIIPPGNFFIVAHIFIMILTVLSSQCD